MNIVHVSKRDTGGAGNVARSLAERMNDLCGVDSTLLVDTKQTDSEVVSELPSLPLERVFNYGTERILSLEGFASPSSFRLRSILRSHDADVLHLHNLHGRFFNLLALLSVPDEIRIVWTFHDMWPFTGNCVYARDCERFKESCGSCPQIGVYPKLSFDTTSLLLRLREFVASRTDITAVCPSRWIGDLAEQSRIPFSSIEHIPNGVDTDRFHPVEIGECRAHFGIPAEDRVVLFLADSVDSNRKGISSLIPALDRLPDKDDVTLLIVGEGCDKFNFDQSFNIRAPGYVPDQDLPKAYAAADLFVIPSLADNFPLTVLESMACGTPVVGFRTGGISEQIVDGETGWLCDEQSADALATTIERPLSDDAALRAAGDAAVQRARRKYELGSVVGQYERLYRSLVGDSAR